MLSRDLLVDVIRAEFKKPCPRCQGLGWIQTSDFSGNVVQMDCMCDYHKADNLAKFIIKQAGIVRVGYQELEFIMDNTEPKNTIAYAKAIADRINERAKEVAEL